MNRENKEEIDDKKIFWKIMKLGNNKIQSFIKKYKKEKKQNSMGNKVPAEEQFPSINIEQFWETINQSSDFRVMKNKLTHKLGEYRQLKLDTKYDLETELQIYGIRKEAKVPIVKVYIGQILSKRKKKQEDLGICGNSVHLQVITERITHRLAELEGLSFEEIYLILGQALYAFEYLFRKVGPVSVSNKMIGINQDGEVRCWINPDWEQNHSVVESMNVSALRQDPQKSYLVIPPEYRDEREMISNIMDVISEKCEEGALPYEFQHLLRANGHTFHQAKDFMHKFSQERKLSIPKIINLTRNSQKRQIIEVKKCQTFPQQILYPYHQRKEITTRAPYLPRSQPSHPSLRPKVNISFVNPDSIKTPINSLISLNKSSQPTPGKKIIVPMVPMTRVIDIKESDNV